MKGPPKFANFLLTRFCRKEYLEEVKGDLEETFWWRTETKGSKKARLRYYLDVFSAIRLISFEGVGNMAFTRSMLFSFVKFSLRNFRRNKAYTFLNVAGLALGMSVALFILQFVSDELSYDQFEDSDRIYRVSQDFVKDNEQLYKTAVTAAPLAPALLADVPKVEAVARLLDYTRLWNGENIFTIPEQPEKTFSEPGAFFADPAIVELFNLKLQHGRSAISEPNTVMLSAEIAAKYFGSAEKAVGQVIQFASVQDKPQLLVTGVYDFPAFNMQVKPVALVSYSTLGNELNRQGLYQMWGVNSSLTYVKLKEGASLPDFERDLANLLLKYNPIETQEDRNAFRIGSLFTMPIEDIHLNSDYTDEVGEVGDANTVQVLLLIAVFVLVIAWVNYVNLATAHSMNRLKELGVRKVMGANKGEIVIQFFVEACFMNVFALVLAIGMVTLGQPFYNQFVDKTLSLEAIDWLRFGMPAILFLLVGILCSGLYPLAAFFSMTTESILKGKWKTASGKGFRKGLIVFQFLSSALLIMGTLAMNHQLDFMRSKDKGMNLNRLLVLDGPTVKGATQEEAKQKPEVLINQLTALANVSYAGVSTSVPGRSILQSQTISIENHPDARKAQFEQVSGSEYLSILNVPFLVGNGFGKTANEQGTAEIILSLSAANELGYENPADALGTLVYRWMHGGRTVSAIVVGVVADYHHESMANSIDPMVFYSGNSRDNHYLVKLESDEVAGTIDEIEKIYQATFPDNPVNYYFLDDFYARQYQSDEVNGRVFAAFSIITILVACLGLFGLSAYVALQRTKEIGVRKILGASVKTLVITLAKDLMLLAALGFLLAVPLGYIGIQRWLDGFAYHAPVALWFFVLPMLIIVLLAFMAIAPRVVKTALMNPVKSLRYE